jgi:hypothetical protein
MRTQPRSVGVQARAAGAVGVWLVAVVAVVVLVVAGALAGRAGQQATSGHAVLAENNGDLRVGH